MRYHIIRSLAVLMLAVSVPITAQTIEQIQDSVIDEQALVFPITKTTRFSRYVNGRSFQQWPLQTHRGYQYAAYFDHNRNVCLGRRQLPDGDWQIIRFTDHQIKSNDSHNVVVVGICEGDGTIHLTFDQHAKQMYYRRSVIGLASDPESADWDASQFGPVTDTLGPAGQVTTITYPRFFPAPNGNLMLYYRSQTSANGDGVIQEYDAQTNEWTPGLGSFISRDIGTYRHNGRISRLRCPYLNGIWYVGDRIHATWVWRDRFERTSARNNHDLCYVYSDDHGRTWHNNAGGQVGVTGSRLLSIDTPGIHVAAIPPNLGPRNQNAQYVYADGTVHVVVNHREQDSRQLAYHHHWRDKDGKWRQESLGFSGSRPTLVGTKDRELLLLYTDDDDIFRIAHATQSDQDQWSWSRIYRKPDYIVGGEALVDMSRWESEQVLTTYAQQAVSHRSHTKSALRITDYRFVPADED